MSMPMGVFRVDCEIVSPRQPRRSVRVRQLLVDSGSELTWVPGTLLDRIGIRVMKKDQLFVLANGQRVTRSVGYAIIRVGDFETIDEVVFAQPGDLSLLGSRTLEGFGAHVDARKKRLVAAGPHLAASPPRR
jgi:predicted aspartyl protease